MGKVVFLGMVLLFCAFARAQDRYYLSVSDYKEGKAVQLDSVWMEPVPLSTQKWDGTAQFRVKTKQKKLKNILKKQARILVCKDTLYVNTYGLKYKGSFGFNKGYAPGFCFGDEIGFKYTRSGSMSGENAAVAVSTVALGLVGGIIVAGALSTTGDDLSRSCYLLGQFEEDEKEVLQIEPAYMQDLLKGHSDLLDSYNELEETNQISAEIVLLFLDKLHGVSFTVKPIESESRR